MQYFTQSRIRRFIHAAGGAAHVARGIGSSRQAVQAWRRVPVEHVLLMEMLTHYRYTRYDMRPDVFGTPDQERHAIAMHLQARTEAIARLQAWESNRSGTQGGSTGEAEASPALVPRHQQYAEED